MSENGGVSVAGHNGISYYSAKPAVVEPIAKARYKVQFNASAELHGIFLATPSGST